MADETITTGRDALIAAFDRLFDTAARKLKIACSEADKAEAKRHFEERFATLLETLKQLELRDLPEEAVREMEQSIKSLSPSDLAALLASVPLAAQAQEMMRQLAYRTAEQRLLAHYIASADDSHGGN